MSSEQEKKPSGPNRKQSVSDLQPIRYAGPRTLGLGLLPPVQFGIFSEKIRESGSKQFQCAIFCDGKKCKYEGSSAWSSEDMAVKGVYSCWVTDDILTMARPSSAILEKYQLVKQFKELGIRSLINLQQSGEHKSCGQKLCKSGFAYDPQIFMENKIFYYNFDWKDYSSVSKTRLLDIVKVLSFALTQGRVAVHSHSGLGRPGVLAACYLIYSLRCKPNDAILFLRSKRSGLVQTKNQVQSIQGFAQYVVPMFIVYSNVIPRDYSSSLNQYLKRQKILLHGFEARLLKHIPKPVFIFCEKLISLVDEETYYDSDTEEGIKKLDLIGDPSRLLRYFSAKSQTDVKQQPSKFSKKRWSLILSMDGKQIKKGLEKEKLMNGGLDADRFCAPPSPPTDVVSKFLERQTESPESPDSTSSPDDSNNRSSSSRMLGGLYRPLEEEEYLDYNLSDDEENGVNPEIEFNNNNNNNSNDTHPNSVPFENLCPTRRRASKPSQLIVANGPPSLVQNGGIGLNAKKLVESQKSEITDIPTVLAIDLNANNNSLLQNDHLVIEDIADADVDDDPLDDMNSEECNAIIDSVLQESASEEEVVNCHHKKTKKRTCFTNDLDCDTVKEIKGCSTKCKSDENEIEEEDCDEENDFTYDDITDALLANHYAIDEDFAVKLRKYQRAINHRTSAWDKVINEKDPLILSALLWSWLDQLREPVLNVRDLSCIVIRSDKPMDILHRLDFGTRYTTEYLVRFVLRLKPKSTAQRDDLLRRIIASLTHQALGIGGTLRPVGKDWQKMRQGTVREVMLFVQTLYDMVLSTDPDPFGR